MARFDAAADPADAISRGLHVRRIGAAADRIAARLELGPSSSVLLLGGIGSGKTTQLLMARARLAEAEDTIALYLDISRQQDLSKLKAGSLMALAGLALAAMHPQPGSEHPFMFAGGRFRTWAEGEPASFQDMEDPGEWEPGVVTPPDLGIEYSLHLRLDDLATLKRCVLKDGQNLVLLVDSLDRLTELKSFATVVTQDVAALSSMGIGLVLVGPTRALHGLEREIAERFEPIVYVSDIDVQHDLVGAEFLEEVLQKRAPSELMTPLARKQLVLMSGGVLRDLIHLGRLALSEAYEDGADEISPQHVGRAADSFGRTRMLGLNSFDLVVLQRVRVSGSFVQTSEQDLALLSTRRLVEYRTPELRYAVHPTIDPLLRQLAGEK